MELANPAALWLLPLALLVWLVRRRRATRQRVVSNLYLWRATPRSRRLRFAFTRLRWHWLALLQVAFILAVIAALARPVISWQQRHAVVIVDVSASMAALDDGVTRLEQARTQVREVLRGLSPRTLVSLVAAGPTPIEVGQYVALDPALGRALDALTPTAGGAALDAAMRSVGASSEAVPDMYVFTDMLPPEPASPGPTTDGPRWITVGRPAQNAAITALSVRRLTATHADGQVLAEVWNHGADARQTEIALAQNDVEIARLPLRLAPDAATAIIVDVPRIGGAVRARLRHDDALAVDDERFAVVPSGALIRVLLATSGSFFLEKALAANPDVALDIAAPSAVVTAAASAHDVVVCDRCSSVPDRLAGVLMILPAAGSGGPPSPLSIGTADHPVVASLEAGDGLLAPVVASAVPPDADVLLLVGDTPAVVAYERRGQRVVELRLDPASSALSLMTAFPVLVANAIDWLAWRDTVPADVRAGVPLSWAVRQSRVLEDVVVEGPNGQVVPARVSGRYVTVAGTAVPGVYRVRGRGWTEAVAVTPATESESDLTRPLTAAHGVPATRPTPAHLASPVATLLIVAALASLMVEWWYRCQVRMS